MTTDCFDEIHNLLKKGNDEQVLRILLNHSSNKIKSPYSKDLNHAWYIIGDIAYKKGDFDTAISAFKKALENLPEDSQAMMALANCYSNVGFADKAELLLRQATRLCPKNIDVIYNLANALFDQGKYKEAIQVYECIPKSDNETYEYAKKNIQKAKKRECKKN